MKEKNLIADTILSLRLYCRGCYCYIYCLDNKVTNASNPAQHSQIKFCLIYWNLGGEIEHSAASDFSSILWVKRCLGNSEKSRRLGVEWGEGDC